MEYHGTGGAPLRHITLREAADPVPDARGAGATAELISLIQSAGERDLVICLISGGGSALLTLPASPVTLEDVQAVTALPTQIGCYVINELTPFANTCRVCQAANWPELPRPLGFYPLY